MIIKKVEPVNLKIKNTFLNKAKNESGLTKKQYWESLHYEAKSRLNYLQFRRAEHDLQKLDETKPVALIKTLFKMAYRKFMSGIYEGKAYGKFPYRFNEPDNVNALEERYYKTNIHKRLV